MALYETKQSSLTDVLCKARDCQLKHSDHPLPKTGYTQHLIVAPKGSGKSSVILNLLHNKEGYRGEFDKIYLCSTTAERDPKFDKLVNELSEDGTFYNTLDDGIVQGIMNDIHNELDEHEKRKKKRKEISGLHDVKRVSTFKKEPPPKFCIIFDDCIHLLPKSGTKSVINELYTRNRHLKTNIITASQKMKLLNPTIRNNTDLLSVWRVNDKLERKAILESWDIPEDIYNYATSEPHEFLHVSYFNGKPLYFKKFDRIIPSKLIF